MADYARLMLPWPPSVNRYWRTFRGRMILSRAVRAYRDVAALAIAESGAERVPGEVSVRITVVPPDRRRRDIDNLLKATLDALTHGGIIDDDSRIASIMIHRVRPAARREDAYLGVEVRRIQRGERGDGNA